MANKAPEGKGRIPLPFLVAGALIVGVLLVLATGGRLPTITTPPVAGPGPVAPQSPITGQGWDQALISLALALTTRLLWLVPVMLVVAGALHLSHVWAHHAKPLVIRVVIGAVFLFLVPVLIVLLPHLLTFRDHIVSELVHGG